MIPETKPTRLNSCHSEPGKARRGICLLFAPPRNSKPHHTPVKNAPGSLNLVGCPLGHEYSFEVSTRICPSGASSTCARSIGRGAGPSKLIPSLSYPLPWHGHLNLFSLGFQSGVQPRCVQRA